MVKGKCIVWILLEAIVVSSVQHAPEEGLGWAQSPGGWMLGVPVDVQADDDLLHNAIDNPHITLSRSDDDGLAALRAT